MAQRRVERLRAAAGDRRQRAAKERGAREREAEIKAAKQRMKQLEAERERREKTDKKELAKRKEASRFHHRLRDAGHQDGGWRTFLQHRNHIGARV
ncbi:protein of unknown function [Bradyrhizobium sp. ORS 285]|nr:protein of unknown function [Bradyrhizobium sp. ORS 285]